jgi:hypothetical protein
MKRAVARTLEKIERAVAAMVGIGAETCLVVRAVLVVAIVSSATVLTNATVREGLRDFLAARGSTPAGGYTRYSLGMKFFKLIALPLLSRS